MVEISLSFDRSECLRSLRMKGHADNGSFGSNAACAAVSLVARSTARIVAGREGWTVDGDASSPGNLSLEIHDRPKDTDEWLRGVGDTLLQALADIIEEFPESISVSVEENSNGS